MASSSPFLPLLDVDEIVVITLKESLERQENIKKQFPLGVPYRFHTVERDPEGGRAGCYRSHADVIQDARKRSLHRVLILEDDVYFNNGWSETVRFGNEALKQVEKEDPEWNYLLFFMYPVRVGRENDYIRKVLCAGSTAAYVVNVKQLKESLPLFDGRDVDNVLFCNYTNVSLFTNKNWWLSLLANRFAAPLSKSFDSIYATSKVLVKPGDFKSTIDSLHEAVPFAMNTIGAEKTIALASAPGFDVIFIVIITIVFITAAASLFLFVRRKKITLRLKTAKKK